MGYKSTILATGAAVICTNGVFADAKIEASKSNTVTKTPQITQAMKKARTSRGGFLAPQSEDIGGRAGGDTPFNATVVAALPFSDTGNNSLNTDAGDETCPDTVSGPGGGLDQWYTYTSGSGTVTVSISLCDPGTNFDTKLYVYAGSLTIGSPYACDDDTCSAGLGFPWVSEIIAVCPPFTTFYCAVDAWSSGDVGNFMGLAQQDTIVPCVVDCASTDVINPDPCVIQTDGDDGCFSANQDEFFAINCEETVCGEFYTDSGLGLRDLDWYELTLTETNDVTALIVSESPGGYQLFFADVAAVGGCAAPGNPQSISFVVSVGTGCTTTGIVAAGLAPGAYWYIPTIFGTDGSVDCPNSQTYRLAITCDCGPYLEGNVNGDNAVNFDDLNIVLGNWAATCGQ